MKWKLLKQRSEPSVGVRYGTWNVDEWFHEMQGESQ